MSIIPDLLAAFPWWPLLVFVIVLMFRKEIRTLASRLRKVVHESGKTAFEFGEASIDILAFGEATRGRLDQKEPSKLEAQPVAEVEQPQADAIRWSNSGNLFWATHDLMLTIDRLLRAAPKEAIFFTLQQSLYHVRALGFKGPPIESKLTELTAEAAKELDFPYPIWPPEMRDYYASKLESIKNELGHLARANQPDFDPGPKVDFPVLDLHP
jgi:hypothetical protein